MPSPPFGEEDCFYRQIPKVFIDAKKVRISPAAFQNTTNTLEMSVDWARLCTAAESMARRPDRAVGQFPKLVCDEQGQECRHDPIAENDAHCSIVGEKPERVKAAFARATHIVIAPDGIDVPADLKVPPEERSQGSGYPPPGP